MIREEVAWQKNSSDQNFRIFGTIFPCFIHIYIYVYMSRRSEIFFSEIPRIRRNFYPNFRFRILEKYNLMARETFQEFKRRRFFVQILFINLFYCRQLFFANIS